MLCFAPLVLYLKGEINLFYITFPNFGYFFSINQCCGGAGSVVDPNTLNLDPDPGFWPNLDPDPWLMVMHQF